MIKISVIMPIYNSAKYLNESIESVINQTYKNWELLAINEYGSNDGSADIIREYEKKDLRIRLVQNEVKLGLAESLNKGFRLAKGEYLARLDADDLAHEERFEKQLQYMEEHKNIGICGSYQHHFGVGTDWTHKTPITPDECRASLLFGCDICHSTLMLRKSTVLNNNLFYNNNYLAEDYELWTRAVNVSDFANIPEVLGEYRVGEDNITNEKKEGLNIESGRIVAEQLERNLGYVLPKNKWYYFQGWKNPIDDTDNERDQILADIELVLRRIVDINEKRKYYNQACLLNVIAAKWRWLKYGEEWNQKCSVMCLDEIFDSKYKVSFWMRLKRFMKYNPTLSMKMRAGKRILLRPMHNFFENIANSKVEELKEYIEWKTWDRYQRESQEINIVKENINELRKESVSQESILKDICKNIAVLEEKIKYLTKEMYETFEQDMLGRVENIVAKTEDRIQQVENDINTTTDARIWKAEQNIIKMQELLAELLLQFQTSKKKLILMNTPLHDNVGDHAIAYAEQLWIKNETDFQVIDIPGNVYRQYHTVIRKFVKEDDVIAITGGGFVGSIWEHEESLVEQILSEYPENAIRIFPQSVFFSGDEEGEKVLNRAKEAFQKHHNLVVFVREELSYEFMKEHFADCKTILSVDMALYLKKHVIKDLKGNEKREGIGLCFKGDKESILSEKQKQSIMECAAKTGQPIESLDTAVGYNISAEDRHNEIMKKLMEFAGYNLIITDRFHGIIFSIIMNTPCIAVGGLSYKNDGICRMLAGYEGICYVADLSEMNERIGSAKSNRKQENAVSLDNLIDGGLKRIYDTLKR